MKKYKATVIIFVFLFSTLVPLASFSQPAALAAEDYEAYKSTKYASEKWDKIVKNGIEAFHSGISDVAHTSLYEAFNKGCESPIVLFMLALLNEQQESFYTALEYYKMAEKGFQTNNKNHRYSIDFDENYGRALYYSGDINRAMPVLKRAGKTTKSYWLLKMLGMLYYEQGDALNALSYLERAIRVPSEDVTKEELLYVYNLLAKLFLYKGEKDGAMRYYQKVLELDPNNPEASRFMTGIRSQYQNQQQNQQMHDLMDKLKDL